MRGVPASRLPWRECGYCGATVRRAYCGYSCQNQAQRLRDVESGHPTRGYYPGALSTAWEDAENEFRLRLAMRMLAAGCAMDMALDEAGFMSSEVDYARRAVWRREAKERRP